MIRHVSKFTLCHKTLYTTCVVLWYWCPDMMWQFVDVEWCPNYLDTIKMFQTCKMINWKQDETNICILMSKIDQLIFFVAMAFLSGSLHITFRLGQTCGSTILSDNLNLSKLIHGTMMNWDNLRVARTSQQWPRSNFIVWNYQLKTLLGESKYKSILRITKHTWKQKLKCHFCCHNIFTWTFTAQGEYKLDDQPVLFPIATY